MDPNTKSIALNFFCGLFAGCAEAIMWTTPTERLKVGKKKLMINYVVFFIFYDLL